MWDAVVFTVHYGFDASAYQTEVDILQREGVFEASTPMLVVGDPADGMGSGGSTLNALLVAVEYLCAKRRLAVLNSELVKESRILIIHLGRQLKQDARGCAFLSLPLWTTTHDGCMVRLTPLIHWYRMITEQIADSSPPGVWVAGCDGLIVLREDSLRDYFGTPTQGRCTSDDILAFSFPVDAAFAADHGQYHTDEKGYVTRLEYRKSPPTTASRTAEKVPLVTALMFMPASAAHVFLGLHAVYPLTSATYLGVDAGVPAFKLSLFFDFLQPTFVGTNRAAFVSAEPILGHTAADTGVPDVLPVAKRAIFDALHVFNTRVVLLPTKDYFYFTVDEMDKCLVEKIARSLAPVYITQSSSDVGVVKIAENDGLKQIFQAYRDADAAIFCQMVLTVLSEDKRQSALSPIQTLVAGGRQQLILDTLDGALSSSSPAVNWRVAGRMLSCIADVLGLMADGNGGLRSGPASNPAWTHALLLLEDSATFCEGVRQLRRTRQTWCGDTPRRLIRAARHYEAAAQIAIRRTVMDVKRFLPQKPVSGSCAAVRRDVWHCTEAAARIDLAGGWSDTPPITYEFGGAVVNVAVKVDGKRPIGGRCRAVDLSPDESGIFIRSKDISGHEVSQRLTDLASVLAAHNNPATPGSLVCAVIVVSGLLTPDDRDLDEPLASLLSRRIGTRALQIDTWSLLPQGSGLGTSSILAGCLLASLWSMLGTVFDTDSLLHAVLYVEQVLTTGGGWQDQVGGLTPGIKIGRFGSTPETARVTVEFPTIGNSVMVEKLRGRLALIYTGKTRLAKNLLQEVIRNWYRREKIVCDTIEALVTNAERCWKAVLEGDLPTFAACCEQYRAQKKVMAHGSEPAEITALIESLRLPTSLPPVALAAWLAGAGGGGFLYVLLAEDMSVKDLKNILDQKKEFSSMTVHNMEIDLNPLFQYTEE